MRKTFKTVLTVLFFVCMAVIFGGCNCNGNNSVDPKKENLKLNYNSYTLCQYEGFNLMSTNYENVSFTSENEQIVTVDDKGYVFGLSVGSTTIVAKCGELTSSCQVTVVENEVKPYIATNVDEFNLYANDEFVVVPKLYFSKLVENAVFTFETDSDCISVDGNGKVTAIKPGEAGIIIKNVFFNKEITKVVTVRVVENITVTVDEYDFSIEKSDVLGGKTSFDISGISVYNGDDLVVGAETYFEFDETLLSRSGNTFTALNTNGKTVDENTTVNVCYDFEDSTYSCNVNVKIAFPVSDERNSDIYYVDNWKDSQKVEAKKIGKDNLSFNYDIFDGKEIKTVSAIVSGADVDLFYNEGSLGVNNLAKGDFVWKVCNSDYGYLISVKVVDFVCFDASSFEKILSVATDETIVLATDIEDFGLLTRGNQNVFSGILDGNGHKITNMKLGQMTGGIFYSCNGAVVQNLSLYNVEMTARFGSGQDAKEYVRGIIAHTLTNTKLINLCIDAFSGSSCIEGVLAYRLSQGVSVQNVVINYRTTYNEHGQTAGLCFMMDSMFAEADGLYIVCSDSIDLVQKQLQYIDKKEIITSTPFNTVQEMFDFFKVDEKDYLIRRYKNNSALKYNFEESEISDSFDEIWENQ